MNQVSLNIKLSPIKRIEIIYRDLIIRQVGSQDLPQNENKVWSQVSGQVMLQVDIRFMRQVYWQIMDEVKVQL